MDYETIKKAILDEANKILNEYDSVKDKILNLFNKMSTINLNNMTSREQLDYKETRKANESINRLNALALLFLFIDKPHDDIIFEKFMEEINKYREKRKEREEAIKHFEKQVEKQKEKREEAVKYFEKQIKNKGKKKKLTKNLKNILKDE